MRKGINIFEYLKKWFISYNIIIKMSYTTYVTTWNKDPLQQIQDMINNSVLTNIYLQ